jgi:hypothetical protein
MLTKTKLLYVCKILPKTSTRCHRTRDLVLIAAGGDGVLRGDSWENDAQPETKGAEKSFPDSTDLDMHIWIHLEREFMI